MNEWHDASRRKRVNAYACVLEQVKESGLNRRRLAPSYEKREEKKEGKKKTPNNTTYHAMPCIHPSTP
jgi:hypothetical protein